MSASMASSSSDRADAAPPAAPSASPAAIPAAPPSTSPAAPAIPAAPPPATASSLAVPLLRVGQHRPTESDRRQRGPDALDVPTLALAIRESNVDAVRSMLEHGAPLDAAAWGCQSAMEMAELMVEYERSDNHYRLHGWPFTPASDRGRTLYTKQSSDARTIFEMLKAEVEARCAVHVGLAVSPQGRVRVAVAARQPLSTWKEPLPAVLAPGDSDAVDTSLPYEEPYVHDSRPKDQYPAQNLRLGYWYPRPREKDGVPFYLRPCTCASHRVLPNVESIGWWDYRMHTGKLDSDESARMEAWSGFANQFCLDLGIDPDGREWEKISNDVWADFCQTFEPVVVRKPIWETTSLRSNNLGLSRFRLAYSPCLRCGPYPASLYSNLADAVMDIKLRNYDSLGWLPLHLNPSPFDGLEMPPLPPKGTWERYDWEKQRSASIEAGRKAFREAQTAQHPRVLAALMHDCCAGQPRGLCAAHDAQGSRFMDALFYKYDSSEGLWVRDRSGRFGVAYSRIWCEPGCECDTCLSLKSAEPDFEYRHLKPAHRPPDGQMWDAVSGIWVPDPNAVPKQPKTTPPQPPAAGASEDDRREWLREFGAFDQREYRFPDDYRKAYKRATRDPKDSERRVQQRRDDPLQQYVHRLGALRSKAEKQ